MQAAQMQKYGGMEESEIPERGYLFAHDKFYVIRNYGLGEFSVTLWLDPTLDATAIDETIRRFNDEDSEEFGRLDW